METDTAVSDPFALMMNPQAVLLAMEGSERLQRLRRHICRPLDKPIIPCAGDEGDGIDAECDDEGLSRSDTAAL